jgi:hypothetical protein
MAVTYIFHMATKWTNAFYSKALQNIIQNVIFGFKIYIPSSNPAWEQKKDSLSPVNVFSTNL